MSDTKKKGQQRHEAARKDPPKEILRNYQLYKSNISVQQKISLLVSLAEKNKMSPQAFRDNCFINNCKKLNITY